MYETLKNDMVLSMKEKDKKRLSVIRLVKSAVDKERIDKKCEVTDALVMDIILKQIKMREDSILSFEKAGRSDLLEEAKEEVAILKGYLPEPLKKEEVEEIIINTIKETGASSIRDMRSVMEGVSQKVKGRADMKEVSSIIREKLS